MLKGKVALITGASGGIGKATAILLAAQGALVYIHYNGSRERAGEVKDMIRSAGGEAHLIQCNVADFASCEEMIKTMIEKENRIDILVNSAGITRDGLMMKMSQTDFNDVIDTNLKGTFHCIRFASRQMMKQRQGRIINIASVIGIRGNFGQTNYAASKAGVIGLTKSAARELGTRGITVNAIAPGFIETEMTAVLGETLRQEILRQIPQGRFGCPDDVANAVAFLASEGSGYITGQVLCVDGGMAM